MFSGSVRDYVIPAILIIVALVTGLLIGAVGWSLFIASLIWIWIQVIEFRKVNKWTKRPLRKPRNGSDGWFALAYRPFRSLTRERERTHDMLMRLRQILGLAELIPDGVIILNANGEIDALNSGAKTMLRLADTDVGLTLASIVRSPDFVAYLRASDPEESVEFPSPFDENTNFEARRFDVEAGGTIVMIRDITTLNRLLTMRQNFVANVSHELRTPLTVVNGYLETLEDPDQDDRTRLELIPRLSSPLNRMQSLVDDLMLLTQLESAEGSVYRHPVQMGHVIEGAVRELSSLAGEGDEIVVQLQSNAVISGNESELHSVCTNLLENAIKYTASPRRIEISWRDVDGVVRLAVEDNGSGIAPEHIDRLTERFYRVDMADSRTRGGTGLGLAIVKHILRRHESELKVQSSLGEGSLFFCDFSPLEQAEADH